MTAAAYRVVNPATGEVVEEFSTVGAQPCCCANEHSTSQVVLDQPDRHAGSPGDVP